MTPSRKTPLFISFSGIDGAGKSTQIANLRALLEGAGLRVQIITFWDEVVRLKTWREQAGQKLFNGDAGVGTPEAPLERRDKNVRSPLMTLIRFGLYTLDALSLSRIARGTNRSEADIVIFDRFIYDEWANLNLQNPFTRLYLRWMVGLVPHCIRAFILDAEPQHARARKPEYPLAFLHENRKAYLALSAFLQTMTVIAVGSIEEASAAIASSVAPLLASSPTSTGS